MTNPYLYDSVERVGRDPRRKLGWDDRLVGTLRLVLQQHIVPRRYALGTAAALAALEPRYLETDVPTRNLVAEIWGSDIMQTKEAEDILRRIEDARHRLIRWCGSGFQTLEL